MMLHRYARRLVPLLIIPAILPLLFSPSTSAENTAGRVLVPEAWYQDHPGPYTVRVDLVVDQQWRDLYGADSVLESQDVVNQAQQLLAPAGIQLQVVSQDTWAHDTSATTIQQLYRQLLGSRSSKGADMTVALAAGYKGPEGGFAGSDQRHTLIKHHPYRTDRDALILTHEVGHALGLDHHNCTHLLCIMSSHDYDDKRHFCPEHLQLLARNGGFFEYLAQTAP